MKFLYFLLVFVFLKVSSAEFCTGKKNDNYPISCIRYYKCFNGNQTLLTCPSGQAFHFDDKICKPYEQLSSPCSYNPDCNLIPDGSYSVPDHCAYFYTCLDKKFFGVNFCNNPHTNDDLVFDDNLKICNLKSAVEYPCGFITP